MTDYIDDVAIILLLGVIAVVGLRTALPIIGADKARLLVATVGMSLIVPAVVVLTMYGHLPKEGAYGLLGTIIGFVGGLFSGSLAGPEGDQES